MNHIKNIFILLLILASSGFAQKQPASNKNVFVDANGILRWEGSNAEVSLFGVNYTTPFAYSYRAQKKMGLNLKKAIDLDVAQMVRLGLDAFRVHVWDRQISDKDGNILDNDHLNLFDYLLSKLEAHGIKIIVTPIAWWGTGWPEADPKEKGFSQFYSKPELITNQDARKAERNYLTQFVNHINPYTKLSYKNDPSIIAMEIINEPSHPDNSKETTDYINEMVKTIRNAGFTKPLFYNISQNWNDSQHAQAVCDANIQGLSFQWYPTDLVHNRMLHGNYLINVNHYSIPSENINGYNTKAKMVYEFEAADVGGSYMYPAMARSFREAGMQFAAMFAYDPSQIAWSNTEYPTHYLNLLYTPSKAISLMIAAKAFHDLPMNKFYGDYPDNDRFGDFRVDYNEDLSEMNSDTAFFYSNSTNDIPKNIPSIKHIAGCGNSSLVRYDGTGAYFLDKIGNGIWKLEVYPDALWIRDPFEPTSMSRQVSRLFWNERKMITKIPDLGEDFEIHSLSGNKEISPKAIKNEFSVKPGIYLLSSKAIQNNRINKYFIKKEKFLDGLYTPPTESPSIYVVNQTQSYSLEKKPLKLNFKIAADKKITDAALFIKRISWRRFEKYPLTRTSGFDYTFVDSSKMLTPGEFEYCVAIKTGDKDFTFPGGVPNSPDKWDFYSNKFWHVRIIIPGEPVAIFNAGRDRDKIDYPQWSPSTKFFPDYISGTSADKISLSLNITFSGENEIPFGFQLDESWMSKTFDNNLDNYKYIVVRARSTKDSSASIGLRFLMLDGKSFGTTVILSNNWQDVEIPVSSLKKNSSLILPFSYPHFLSKIWSPLDNSKEGTINLNDLGFFQIICDKSNAKKINNKWETGFEIESVYLAKDKIKVL